MKPSKQLTKVMMTLTHLVRGSTCCGRSSRIHLTEIVLCGVDYYCAHYTEIGSINPRSSRVLFIRRQPYARDYNI